MSDSPHFAYEGSFPKPPREVASSDIVAGYSLILFKDTNGDKGQRNACYFYWNCKKVSISVSATSIVTVSATQYDAGTYPDPTTEESEMYPPPQRAAGSNPLHFRDPSNNPDDRPVGVSGSAESSGTDYTDAADASCFFYELVFLTDYDSGTGRYALLTGSPAAPNTFGGSGAYITTADPDNDKSYGWFYGTVPSGYESWIHRRDDLITLPDCLERHTSWGLVVQYGYHVVAPSVTVSFEFWTY